MPFLDHDEKVSLSELTNELRIVQIDPGCFKLPQITKQYTLYWLSFQAFEPEVMFASSDSVFLVFVSRYYRLYFVSQRADRMDTLGGRSYSPLSECSRTTNASRLSLAKKAIANSHHQHIDNQSAGMCA